MLYSPYRGRHGGGTGGEHMPFSAPTLIAALTLSIIAFPAAHAALPLSSGFKSPARPVRTALRDFNKKRDAIFRYERAGEHFACRNAAGEAGFNTVSILDLLQSRKGECADLAGANLSGADLNGSNLRGANLTGAYLRGTIFFNADLSGVRARSAALSRANLRSAALTGANLSGSDLRGAVLYDTDLSAASLESANLNAADLRRARYDDATVLPFDDQTAAKRGMIKRKAGRNRRSVASLISADDKISGFKLRWNGAEYRCMDQAGNPGLNSTAGEHVLKTKKGSCSDQQGAFMFRGADLTDADLSGADLTRADARVADMRGANMLLMQAPQLNAEEADFSGAFLFVAAMPEANLRRAKLFGADLSGADLKIADFTGADLSVADMIGTRMPQAVLFNANLKEADLRWADLTGADLRGANLQNADLEGTVLDNAQYDAKTILPFASTEAVRRGMIQVEK